jgi:hypothetical protein
MRLPRKPLAVIVMPIFVPTGTFFFLYGLRRSSLRLPLRRLEGLPLVGAALLLLLLLLGLAGHDDLRIGRQVLGRERQSFVNFGNASELMLVVDGTVVSAGGGGGGGGVAAVVKPTSAPGVTKPSASIATTR